MTQKTQPKEEVEKKDLPENKEKREEKSREQEDLKTLEKKPKEDSQEKTSEKEEIKKTPKPRFTTRLERRGRKYREVASLIDKKRVYEIDEAIELLKKTNYVKFDPTVEFHTKVLIEGFRTTVILPHGSGKEKRIAIFAGPLVKEKIAEIERGKIDFDIAIATPEAMRELAKVAKILGPRGLMPSPKSGTVSDNPEEVAKEFQKGKIELRADKGGAIHQAIGKLSWPSEKLKENLLALFSVLPHNKLGRLWLTTTMGPSIRIAKPERSTK